MKKALIAFNIVLLVAVGILYLLYFTYVSEDIHEKKIAQAQVANTFKVAYFDFDTLDTYYEYSKQVRQELMAIDSENERKLTEMRSDIANEIKKFNKVGASLTQTEQSNFQQRLNDLQINYQNQQQQLGQSMNSEYIQREQAVKFRIQKFLKTYCRNKGYAYVFGTKEYDDIMYYKDTIRNITRDLIKGLNEEYVNERK
ncbi:MAG TPA: OmpH family outer membrane protein [Chitinophagaceae bacterium]|nr:OmpH family outer membrane protein [Chitinophagaceae bacterium]